MRLVIVGHVDHGKSTLVGRLMADTDSLTTGKLDFVKNICDQQGKSFEFAFLLDALEEEQKQGITIDASQIFFKTKKRPYVIIDAPGHKEFLKNMVTGAANAEAALLLIDAYEGVQEQSRRHGYILRLLGMKQVAVVVNKMDLVDYDPEVFYKIKSEYTEFLKSMDVEAREYIPVSAKLGENLAKRSENMSWYQGPTVLEMLDQFEDKVPEINQPFRLPLQDVYKFDGRRILAGRVESGKARVGDTIIFSPSNKRGVIKSIETWKVNKEPKTIEASHSVGITLTEQIFVERGDIATLADDPPIVTALDFGREIFANITSVAIFALPPTGDRSAGGMPIPDVAAAITVNDPAKSEALWTTILGVAGMATGTPIMEGEKTQIAGTSVRTYSLPENMTLYFTTLGNDVVVATTKSAMARTIEAKRKGKSVASDSAFATSLARLNDKSTKGVFVHAGRCAQIAKMFMPPGELAEAKPFLDALERTVVAIVVEHSDQVFGISASVSGIPDIGDLVGMQLTMEANKQKTRTQLTKAVKEGRWDD
ncbi:MAG: GTP-binding protein, partial [Nitrospinae bacterium]|nr:GTP-binding protein [Nitrospinota bacterium]